MAEWHLYQEGSQQGPYSEEEVRQKAAGGSVNPATTLAWTEGMEDWKPLAETGLLPQTPAAAPATNRTPVLRTRPVTQTPNPGPASPLLSSPYVAPATSPGEPVGTLIRPTYPGLGRLAYFGLQFLLVAGFFAACSLIGQTGEMDPGSEPSPAVGAVAAI